MTKCTNYDKGAVERLFETQGGLATRAQLIELGVPPSTLRLREGPDRPWSRVLKGVCASRADALKGLGRIRAALLYAGPGAIVTGLAALRVHRVAAARTDDPRIKVLIPHGRRRQSHGFVLVGRTTRPPEPVRIEGCAVAPLPRAAVDACLDLKDKEFVRSIINELVYSRRCTPAELCAELAAHQVQRSARMRAVLAEFSAGIRTGEEADCQERLARAIAPRPVWNRRIVEQATGCVAVLPGALWPDRGIALEVAPGFQPSSAALDRAAARRRWMATVLRLTVAQVSPSQVRERWDEVWEELSRLLDRPPTYRLPRGYALA
ncbi:hypothetical protein [Actinospica sp.]|uniref:hypothetical protein n=1 Tax=Actinospica sp. TaxID=1872142 RepID=UPI002BF5122D|nr:hypothetical protein [Actinospica sp.]HWG27974.1 hypothetical protein [Actinospica sp.]